MEGLSTLPDLVVVVVEGCVGGDDGAGSEADGENSALVGMLKTLFATVADPSVVGCAEGDCYQQELFLLVHEGSVRELSYP